VAEQLLDPPQSPADLDDDREVLIARVLDALRQLVNLGAAFLRDAAIVKEGLGQSFAQRDRARDLVGDERRLKTLSARQSCALSTSYDTSPDAQGERHWSNCGWLKVSRLTSAGAVIPLGMLWHCWREMPARATSRTIGPAEGRGKTGGTGVIVRHAAA